MNQKSTLSCWGNYPNSSAFIKRIERYHDLMPEHEGKTIARGLGRSYGDAALNADHTVLLMHRMNRMLAFDEKTGVLNYMKEGSILIDHTTSSPGLAMRIY